MSHFSLVVVTDTKPSKADLDKILAPYHQFECTGINNEYVKDIDETEKLREEYTKDKDKDGTFVEWLSYCYEKHAVPYGEKPDTSDDGKHLFGYVLLDQNGEVEKVINRTNPNYKWDWWVIGGRYRERLITTGGARIDSAPVGALDFDAMRKDLAESRTKWVNDVLNFTPERRDILLQGWKDYVKAGGHKGYEERRGNKTHQDFIRENPEDPQILASEFAWLGLPDSVEDPFTWANQAPPLTTFAVLKDGVWAQQGEMAMFGIVLNRKCEVEWEQGFTKLIEDLPATSWLTVIDCHV